MKILGMKFKENVVAVVPIVLAVVILQFTLISLETSLLVRFIIGAVLVIIGLSLFLIGVDLGITPLGRLTGSSITKTNKLWIVLVAGIILGFFISIAEPGLLVFAQQVQDVTQEIIRSTVILMSVSIGLAILVALGFLRMIYNIPLYKIIFVLYLIIFVMALFASPEFLGIAFDASGATTGVLAVPFLLALSVGVSKLKKDSKSSEKDSFGLVSIASTGAIMSLLILNYFLKDLSFSTEIRPPENISLGIIQPFIAGIGINLKDTSLAMLPLLVIFLVLSRFNFQLTRRAFMRMFKGFIYAFIGLFIFLLGVNAGFMEVGQQIGYQLAGLDQKIFLIITAFVLGLLTIVAEPAVFVLTHQIEDITAGYVKRKTVLIPLAIGVGIAVMISIIRILTVNIQLWHYLLPGYIIALALMFITPKLFVGIAYDAGGVATGPMTATFILAFTQGAAQATPHADVVIDGFGMIAMVALTPIITLQLLGILYKVKTRKVGIN